METRPDQPSEGKLITEALTRAGLSIREASRRAGISYGRWRQITGGFQNVSPGSYAAVKAPASTLARMAAAAGVTPAQLAEAGRDDAADVLTSILETPPPSDEGPAFIDLTDQTEAHIWHTPGLSAPERQAIVAFLRSMRSVAGAAALEQEYHRRRA
jgi:lambda repressor-like predicted transcriptional regulator